MLDGDSDLWFETNDFYQTLLRAEEIEVSVEDVENRMEEKDSDPLVTKSFLRRKL